MGKIADIIRKNSVSEADSDNHHIIYSEMFDEAEKEIIELIERKLIPSKLRGAPLQYQEGFNYCRDVMFVRLKTIDEI